MYHPVKPLEAPTHKKNAGVSKKNVTNCKKKGPSS